MLAELAAAAGSGGEDLNSWLRSLGSFAAAGAVGWAAFRRESARADRAEVRADAERDRANALVDRMVDDVIPAIERATAGQRDFVEAARDQLRYNSAQHSRRDPAT